MGKRRPRPAAEAVARQTGRLFGSVPAVPLGISFRVQGMPEVLDALADAEWQAAQVTLTTFIERADLQPNPMFAGPWEYSEEPEMMDWLEDTLPRECDLSYQPMEPAQYTMHGGFRTPWEGVSLRDFLRHCLHLLAAGPVPNSGRRYHQREPFDLHADLLPLLARIVQEELRRPAAEIQAEIVLLALDQ